MNDAQTEARAIVSAALPPHEQAMLGGDAIVVLADLIAAALTTERAAHAETKRELLEMEKSQMRQASACGMATSRAEAAEAQRDEALKAQNYLKDAVLCGLSDQEIARRARLLVEAARRALEAQGGE